MYIVIKVVDKNQKSQLEYYQLVLYTIKHVLSIKVYKKHNHPVVLTTTLRYETKTFYKNQQQRDSTKMGK